MACNMRAQLLLAVVLGAFAVPSSQGQTTDSPRPTTVNPADAIRRQQEDKDWWKKTIIYQIYPRSFQDSDGDGVGDLQGILSRLDHFAYLGVDTLWLSPIYTSPMADFGYDVADHRDIDPVFGTMADFDELIAEIHQRGMKLIMDFIPNHTSDQHPWFVASRDGVKSGPYRDYYRWHAGVLKADGTRSPPNNWLSFFGGPAWTWSESRHQFYLHQFAKEQPDLDYRNPRVRQAMKDVLEFWIRKGVDGFRVDAIHTLFEPENVEGMDEPPSGKPGVTQMDHESLDHRYTLHQNEIHEVTQEWRDLFDDFEEETGKHIYMVMEVYSVRPADLMAYYSSGADQPFNFNLIFLNPSCHAVCARSLVDAFLDNMPEGGWPGHVLGNHDNRRITTRRDPVYVDALNMLLLTLPGTPTTYYGEEIGQRDVEVSFADTQDPWGRNFGPELYQLHSRDPERAPMQWDASPNAGFSTADTTWIRVHPDHGTRNVQAQKEAPTLQSSIQLYRALAKLRRRSAFTGNARLNYHVVDDNVLSYTREDDHERYLVALNLGPETSLVDLTVKSDGLEVKEGVVEVMTVGLEAARPGKRIPLESVKLSPGDGIVLKLVEPDSGKLEL